MVRSRLVAWRSPTDWRASLRSASEGTKRQLKVSFFSPPKMIDSAERVSPLWKGYSWLHNLLHQGKAEHFDDAVLPLLVFSRDNFSFFM